MFNTVPLIITVAAWFVLWMAGIGFWWSILVAWIIGIIAALAVNASKYRSGVRR